MGALAGWTACAGGNSTDLGADELLLACRSNARPLSPIKSNVVADTPGLALGRRIYFDNRFSGARRVCVLPHAWCERKRRWRGRRAYSTFNAMSLVAQPYSQWQTMEPARTTASELAKRCPLEKSLNMATARSTHLLADTIVQVQTLLPFDPLNRQTARFRAMPGSGGQYPAANGGKVAWSPADHRRREPGSCQRLGKVLAHLNARSIAKRAGDRYVASGRGWSGTGAGHPEFQQSGRSCRIFARRGGVT